jgi:hypothetical protein
VIWNCCAAAAPRLIFNTVGCGLVKRNAGETSRTVKLLLVFKRRVQVQWQWVRIRSKAITEIDRKRARCWVLKLERFNLYRNDDCREAFHHQGNYQLS